MESRTQWNFNTPIMGAALVTRQAFEDQRGHFSHLELAHPELGAFKEANYSFSFVRVARGLHVQTKKPLGKLITCVFGEICDVIVDLRSDSATFKQIWTLNLSYDVPVSVYVPPGCAHGFCVLSRYAVTHYHYTTTYDADGDLGINLFSPEIIREAPWLETIEWTQSPRDRTLPTIAEFLQSHGGSHGA